MAETAPASRSASRFAPEASPSAPRYAPEDPTLPKPWKGLVDGSTGYLYFWNPDTNVTQYERPKGPTSRARSPTHTKSSAPISSSVQIHHSSHGHLGSSRMDEDVRHNGDISGRPKLAAIPGGRSHQVCPSYWCRLLIPLYQFGYAVCIYRPIGLTANSRGIRS